MAAKISKYQFLNRGNKIAFAIGLCIFAVFIAMGVLDSEAFECALLGLIPMGLGLSFDIADKHTLRERQRRGW